MLSGRKILKVVKVGTLTAFLWRGLISQKNSVIKIGILSHVILMLHGSDRMLEVLQLLRIIRFGTSFQIHGLKLRKIGSCRTSGQMPILILIIIWKRDRRQLLMIKLMVLMFMMVGIAS